jgi:DNA-binding NtrC family response regulator
MRQPRETYNQREFSQRRLVVASLMKACVGWAKAHLSRRSERELVLQTLARCHGNRTHAARVLGLSVRTMRNKIRQYAIDGIDIPVHS